MTMLGSSSHSKQLGSVMEGFYIILTLKGPVSGDAVDAMRL